MKIQATCKGRERERERGKGNEVRIGFQISTHTFTENGKATNKTTKSTRRNDLSGIQKSSSLWESANKRIRN